MPTLTVARGESKKKEAASNVDFGAIWEIVTSDLIHHEVRKCTHFRVHYSVIDMQQSKVIQVRFIESRAL